MSERSQRMIEIFAAVLLFGIGASWLLGALFTATRALTNIGLVLSTLWVALPGLALSIISIASLAAIKRGRDGDR